MVHSMDPYSSVDVGSLISTYTLATINGKISLITDWNNTERYFSNTRQVQNNQFEVKGTVYWTTQSPTHS